MPVSRLPTDSWDVWATRPISAYTRGCRSYERWRPEKSTENPLSSSCSPTPMHGPIERRPAHRGERSHHDDLRLLRVSVDCAGERRQVDTECVPNHPYAISHWRDEFQIANSVTHLLIALSAKHSRGTTLSS